MVKFSKASTLLLAGFAVWAGMVLVAALFGAGARYADLPVDASLAKAIPSVKIAQNKATLGPLQNYAEMGNRPLLMFDRRPGPVPAAPGENAAAELDVSLGSVLLASDFKMAIFRENQGGATRRVRVGDLVEGTGWRLVQLEPRRAVLEGPSGQRAIDLMVFNGKGGQSPTPIAVTATPQASNAENANPGVVPVAQTTPANTNAVATTAAPSNKEMTQEQQIEAIRQRIAARRAQMQADAAKAALEANK